jgi:hypothetical protein
MGVYEKVYELVVAEIEERGGGIEDVVAAQRATQAVLDQLRQAVALEEVYTRLLEHSMPHMRRRGELLLSVPPLDRADVANAAQRRVNLTGERHSDALESVVREYHADAAGFKARRAVDHAVDRQTQEMERMIRGAGVPR